MCPRNRGGLSHCTEPEPASILRSRLALLMFLQYAVPGATLPFYSLRMQELGFSPVEIGWLCASQALSALIAPLVAGQVADRWLASDRCVAVCSGSAAVLLWILAECTDLPAVF